MLHQARGFIEADFGELCEDHSLPDKLNSLEAMCEEQGIADGDAAEAARCVGTSSRVLGNCNAERGRGLCLQAACCVGSLGWPPAA